MLNLDPNALARTCVSAALSANLLRDEGEVSKAARLESLARTIVRELLASGDEGAEVLKELLAHDSPAVRALCHSQRISDDRC